jgi:hypothetical protein
MANKKGASQEGMPFPLMCGIWLGVFGGLLSAASFVVINYWPQPISVAPYFGFREGFVWGAVVGFAFGVILGFLCDDKHFEPQA